MEGFIIYPTYRIIDGESYVYLFGKLKNGESFLTMNKFAPYFTIKKTDLKKAEESAQINNLSFISEESDFKDFNNEEVVKIIVKIPREVPQLRQVFEKNEIACYEADIKFPFRFMLDNGIKTVMKIDGEFKKGNYVDRIYEEPDLSGTKDFVPKLSIFSYDLETDEKFNIFSAAYYFYDEKTGEEKKKVLIINERPVKGAENVKTEKQLLEIFLEEIKNLDPDIITGWNLIDFDMKVLRDSCKKNKVPFVLGRADWESTLRIQSDFFKTSKADVAGRQVLDGIDILKGAWVKLEDYKLDTAASEFLGKNKTESFDGEDKLDAIKKLYMEEPEKLVKYNLVDAELVYQILKKKKLIELTSVRSLLIGMPMDRVNSSIASLDQLYIRETRKRKIVCPSNIVTQRDKRITGGYVRDSDPGIFNYVLVLDFKSLYPSIIRTFNIDPYSFDDNGEIEAPNGAKFRNEEGVLPYIIQKLWEQRDKAKKDKNDIASFAIKITMNSFFGVLANPNCRFYNLKLANGITYFGRKIVQETATQVEKMGYKVIYSDTDSIFVYGDFKSYNDSEKVGLEIQKKINEHYTKFVKDTYGRENFVELEFEKIYKMFLMPKIRGSDKGAKKRYAGLIEKEGKERLDVVGLESVRSDWTDLAKEFQEKLLQKIFTGKEIEKYIVDTVKKLKDGKLDDLLVYKKSIRKDLDEYTKTTPPHVKAARQLEDFKGTIVKYVMTTKGPQPIELIKDSLDYEHYIEKQLKPIAESVLVFYDRTFKQVLTGRKQATLGEF